MFYRQKTHSVYYSHALGGKKKIENCFMMPTLSDYVGVSRILHQFPGLPNGSPNLLQTEFWAFLCFFGFLICVLSAVPAVPAHPLSTPLALPFLITPLNRLTSLCAFAVCKTAIKETVWPSGQRIRSQSVSRGFESHSGKLLDLFLVPSSNPLPQL